MLSCNAQQNYFVDSYENCNNVYGAVGDADTSTTYVRYLGTFSSTNDCIQQCINNSTTNADDRCESYTFHTKLFAEPYKSHCYGRFGQKYGSLWLPVQNQQNVNCGRIIWHCSSDLDCELNGECNVKTGNCSCSKAWIGYKCQTLNLLPATKGTGYHIINDNNSTLPTSSWGGAVIVDPNNDPASKYSMFLAEFDNHCGVDSWAINSVVSHAQSTNGYNSAFKRVSVIWPHFAHEPDAKIGPNGEIVLFYAAFNFSSSIKECECSDGSTSPCNMPNGQFINILQYSASGSVNGPWIREVFLPHWDINKDTTPSGIITQNGTFVGLIKDYHEEDDFTCYIHSMLSTNWKDGKKYIYDKNRLFPQLTRGGTEDPFVYTDCNGDYHAIFHNMTPMDMQDQCGGHAYSQNGIDWIYAGISYSNYVEFTDKTDFTFPRRERPHFIFDDDGCTPIALTTGVQYGGKYGDATYTLLQPIAH